MSRAGVETRPSTRVLLRDATIPAGGERRLMPRLDVRRYDRLHVHVGADARSVDLLGVRVLFGTPIDGLHCGALLADSTVWFEETTSRREFSFVQPASGETGFVVSVPVVAPELYDVILTNTGSTDLTTVHVAIFAQEI